MKGRMDSFIETIWCEFEDIPMDERSDGELILSEDWRGFPKGTSRTEIWHWFDQNYSKGIAELINGEEKR